ncbi:MAG: hypothetical protein HN868_18255 [Gammaproteobacteria bacterium]|nr:hypothetical protein [Gammaproteobacteria bacterium]MBT4449495.1 hypothetical protein [Gammaproteobacteria bacterium]MBT7209296.1 hypothetical protein [Gammaproteobacteria bacterium]
MISESAVFDAVRRGYNDFEYASNSEILDYFSDIEEESIAGHVSNIKGILFEQEYVDQLATQSIYAEVFEATNHPVSDIAIFEDGEIVNELQLKATDSVSYINSTIADEPDVVLVVTSEIANSFDTAMVIDSGIENAALEQAVGETLLGDVVNPFSPLSLIGLMFGVPLF